MKLTLDHSDIVKALQDYVRGLGFDTGEDLGRFMLVDSMTGEVNVTFDSVRRINENKVVATKKDLNSSSKINYVDEEKTSSMTIGKPNKLIADIEKQRTEAINWSEHSAAGEDLSDLGKRDPTDITDELGPPIRS